MGVIALNVSDDFRDRVKGFCSARGVSMTRFLTTLAENEMVSCKIIFEKPSSCVCLMCGFEWSPRNKNPAACPVCKSYKWNNTDEQARKNERIKNRENRVALNHEKEVVRQKRKAVREQKQMHQQFCTEYNRVKSLTKFSSAPEVSELCGIPVSELSDLVRGVAPVNVEKLELMRGVV